MNTNHLSIDSDATLNIEVQEFNLRKKISSCCNRLLFLKRCISEKVLPRSAPQHLRSEDVPFTKSARFFLGRSLRNS